MLLQSIARHSLVESESPPAFNTEGFRSPQANCQHCAIPFRATDGVCPMEKLSVRLWGMSISAEGLWAIAAAIIIVGLVAAVIALA
jgi:hypothetical protein